MAEFLARAVKAQAKRDELSLHMGLNPITGEKLQQIKEGGTDYEYQGKGACPAGQCARL